jgi:hypothetical protein
MMLSKKQLSFLTYSTKEKEESEKKTEAKQTKKKDKEREFPTSKIVSCVSLIKSVFRKSLSKRGDLGSKAARTHLAMKRI